MKLTRRYVVTVPARGHQIFCVDNAKSKADALRKAREYMTEQNDPDVDPITGELEVLFWSTAKVEVDE